MNTPISHSPKLHPLLAQYALQLAVHPLRTKALTSATLSFLQEVIGSNAAGLPPTPTPKDASPLTKILARYHIDAKAIKMAIYGFFVSAPLGHYLVGLLQKAFTGKVGVKYRVAQLVASNFLVAPVQTTVFLASMAIINGAKSLDDVIRTVKGGFWAVIRVTWIVSPLSMVFAQQFVPTELWVPFFNMVQFTLGTLFNIKVKKMRLAAAKKEAEERDRQRAKETVDLPSESGRDCGPAFRERKRLSCLQMLDVDHWFLYSLVTWSFDLDSHITTVGVMRYRLCPCVYVDSTLD